MEMKKFVFIFLFFFLISGVFALQGITKEGVKYDKEIIEKLNIEKEKKFESVKKSLMTQDVWVSVVVQIKDLSNITIDYDKDSVETQLEKEWQIVNFSEKVTDDILEDLERDEFALKKVSYFKDSFSGNITKKGFEKLLKDERIQNIHSQKKGNIDLVESVSLINATAVWNLNPGYTGEGQTICLIDTGVDYSNLDLGGCSQAEFLSGTCDTMIGGWDFYNGDDNPMDDNGHGTIMAGILISSNDIRKGVSPDSRIVVLKACDENGICDDDIAIKDSLDWCRINKNNFNITSVVMSFHSGFCGEDFADDEIQNLTNIGISIFAASGNQNKNEDMGYPACNPNVISVGMTYDGGSGEYCSNEVLGICVGCIDNLGWTKCTTLNGVMNCSIDSDGIC